MTNKRSPRKSAKRARPRDPNRYPKGWNRQKVQAVLEHYKNQSDEEAIAEAEAAYEDPGSAMIQVPVELVPRVQKLLARYTG
ncbi:MAG: hypothetical protein AMXMBFR13_44240 [Phycisphaerae bacterium]